MLTVFANHDHASELIESSEIHPIWLKPDGVNHLGGNSPEQPPTHLRSVHLTHPKRSPRAHLPTGAPLESTTLGVAMSPPCESYYSPLSVDAPVFYWALLPHSIQVTPM